MSFVWKDFWLFTVYKSVMNRNTGLQSRGWGYLRGNIRGNT